MAFCFPWSGGGVLAFGNGTCVSKVCFSFSLDPLFPLGSLLVLVPNNSIFEGSGNREQAENEGVFLYPPTSTSPASFSCTRIELRLLACGGKK